MEPDIEGCHFVLERLGEGDINELVRHMESCSNCQAWIQPSFALYQEGIVCPNLRVPLGNPRIQTIDDYLRAAHVIACGGQEVDETAVRELIEVWFNTNGELKQAITLLFMRQGAALHTRLEDFEAGWLEHNQELFDRLEQSYREIQTLLGPDGFNLLFDVGRGKTGLDWVLTGWRNLLLPPDDEDD